MDDYTPRQPACGNCGRPADGADLCMECVSASEPARRTCCPGCGRWWRVDELVPHPLDGGLECPQRGEGADWMTVTEAGTR
jgi:hypothetical protein